MGTYVTVDRQPIDFLVQRDEQEIGDLLDAVAETPPGSSDFPSLSYEHGIEAALKWLFGHTEEHPYSDGERGAS